MALVGFKFSSWLGWLLGIFYVQKPWGLPKFIGYFHPYILYSLTITVCNHLLWVDFHSKTMSVTKEISLTNKILLGALTLAFSVFDDYFRLVFFVFKKDIPEFLTELELITNAKMKHNQLYKCLKFHIIFSWVTFIPRCICPIIILLWYSQILPKDEYTFIPVPWYFIVFFFVGQVPTMFPIIFAYDLIYASTFKLLRAFEDFCESIEDSIFQSCPFNSKHCIQTSMTSTDTKSSDDKYDLKERPISPQPSMSLSITGSCEEFSELRICFMRNFDKIKQLCNQYDKVLGPLILGVILRSVLMIIHSVNSLLLVKTNSMGFLNHLFDCLVLFIEIFQLTILILGSHVHETITDRKEKLRRAVLFMKDEKEKTLMMELINLISTWNWRITAWKLFEVDRQLICGIVTTTLSYVVLLFQINLSDQPSTPLGLNDSVSNF